VEIRETNWGIAYRGDNFIEINPIIKRYPKLYNKILAHELEHTDKGLDFMHDFNSSLGFRGIAMLLFRHPKMIFQSAIPVWYDEGELNYNLFLLIIYGIEIMCVIIFMWLI